MSTPSETLIDLGGDERIRTADLLSAIQALSQLSYVPTLRAGHARPRRRTIDAPRVRVIRREKPT